MENQKEVNLDDATRAYVAELNQVAMNAGQQMQAALQLFIRQNKLEGNWRLGEDGTKIIRADAPQVVEAVPEPQPNFTKKNPNRRK